MGSYGGKMNRAKQSPQCNWWDKPGVHIYDIYVAPRRSEVVYLVVF